MSEKKKSKKWWIILGIIALAVIGILIAKMTKSANKELVIRTHVVGEYTVENTVTATGTIEPVETVEVGTQVSGKVEKIYVDFNDAVKKGELLAELDKLTLNQNVSRAKASLTSAESQLNYAKLTYERTKQLAFFHCVVEIDINLFHFARHLGTDFDGLHWLDGACGGDGVFNGVLLYHVGTDHQFLVGRLGGPDNHRHDDRQNDNTQDNQPYFAFFLHSL